MSTNNLDTKNKGGRPVVIDYNLRKHKISIHLTDSEKAAFILEMKQAKFKVAAKYLYQCWLNNTSGGENRLDIKKDLLFQIRKIGNNINQIAFELNSRKYDNLNERTIEELKLVIEKQNEIIKFINK